MLKYLVKVTIYANFLSNKTIRLLLVELLDIKLTLFD